MNCSVHGGLLGGAALALVLSGCGAQIRKLDDPIGQPRAKAEAESDAAGVYTEAVRALMQQGHYYAALAHLQEDRRSHGDSAELRLLEADARRNLGQDRAAAALYQGLLDGAQAAQAYHGLGRIHASGDLAQAIVQLRKASALRPTDVDIRNDLGYALMKARRYSEARIELATAAELAPGEPKSRNNLLILLMLMRDEAAVRRIASSTGVDEPLLARLRLQALSLQSPTTQPKAGGTAPLGRTGGAG
ncbi:MAG: tetratricopeptide repeat protein [Stagnimonas sp.]|nr:tetratricopeptide repeat protein [Stagnimonas sp.]